MTPDILVAASALIFLALGVAHLYFTFYGAKLKPRDAALEARMKEVSPVIARGTTMWRAWIGFNASHSCSAILFACVYGYLAFARGGELFHSVFLALLGGLFLAVYLVLAKIYWFRAPYRWVLAALVLYAAGFVTALV